MRNRLLLGLAGGGILLVGLVTGALLSGGLPVAAFGLGPKAPAATSASGDYCALYEQTLANNLNVSESTLESANASAMKTVIQQAHKDGKISQTQEQQLLAKADQLGTHPCAALQQIIGHSGGRAAGALGSQLAGARQAIVNAVAPALKLQPATLESDLAAGQTITQLASAQGASLSAVNSAYLGAVQTQLKNAVGAGTITQPQSDQAYSMIQRAVAAGHYPGLEGRGMHPWASSIVG